MNVRDLLTALGIVARREGGRWIARCPNPSHGDSTPSWSIVDAPGRRQHGSHNCFGCDLRGGPWELASAVWGCSVKDAGERLGSMDLRSIRGSVVVTSISPITCRSFRLPPGMVFPRSLSDWPDAPLRYLRGRGVTPSQIRRWGVGYRLGDPRHRDLADRVVFPIVTRGRLVNFTARAYAGSTNRKYLTGSVKSGADKWNALMGDQHLDLSLGAVTVSEGAFKVMILERAGWPNPCGLLGSTFGPLTSLRLRQFPLILVATDPDKAGDKVAAALMTLQDAGRRVVRVSLPADPDEMDESDLRDLGHRYL